MSLQLTLSESVKGSENSAFAHRFESRRLPQFLQERLAVLTAEMKKLPVLSKEECDAAIARVELLKAKLSPKNCYIQLLKAAAFNKDNDFKHYVGMHFGKKTKMSVETLDNAQAKLQVITKNLLFKNPTLKAIVTKINHHIDFQRSEVRIGELQRTRQMTTEYNVVAIL
jgi:hypothetical protein